MSCGVIANAVVEQQWRGRRRELGKSLEAREFADCCLPPVRTCKDLRGQPVVGKPDWPAFRIHEMTWPKVDPG
jgi:hypothetical protein